MITLTKEAAEAAREIARNRSILTKQTRELINALEPKQRMFVMEYLKDFNGTQAAIRAGYSKKTANEQAAQHLAKLSISAAVDSAIRDILDRSELQVAEVDAILASMIRANPADYAQLLPDGDVVYAFDADSRHPHAVEEVISRITTKGNDENSVTIRTAGVRLAQKKPLLELFYKRFGHLAPEKQEHTISDLMIALNKADQGGVAAPRLARGGGHAAIREAEPTQAKASKRTRGAGVLAAATGVKA